MHAPATMNDAASRIDRRMGVVGQQQPAALAAAHNAPGRLPVALGWLPGEISLQRHQCVFPRVARSLPM